MPAVTALYPLTSTLYLLILTYPAVFLPKITRFEKVSLHSPYTVSRLHIL